MKIIRRSEDNVGFQLAPMIDMTFLLLIFFMVTTKISKEQIKEEIKLPVASNALIPLEASDRDIISIDGEGRYFIGPNPADKKHWPLTSSSDLQITRRCAFTSGPTKIRRANKSRRS